MGPVCCVCGFVWLWCAKRPSRVKSIPQLGA